ncbi:hypothetical protein ACFE04_027866 [Oxalis oulophora]
MRKENGDKCEFVIEHDTMMTEMVDDDDNDNDNDSGLTKCLFHFPMKWKSEELRSFLREQRILALKLYIPCAGYVMTSRGTFALYSLICRRAKISLIPNQLPSDARISSFRLKVPSSELERSLKFKERLENLLPLKKRFFMLVLANTSTVIAHGVEMPAMLVLSALVI